VVAHSGPMAACPECGAVNGHLMGCSQDAYGAAIATARATRSEPRDLQFTAEEERFELRSRLLAPAVVLAVTALMAVSGIGRFFLRVFFGMPLHELGHAVSAWLCGVIALPTFWFTRIEDSRSWFLRLLMLGGLAYLGRRSFVQKRYGRVAVWSALAVVLVVCGFFLPMRTAKALFYFAGDGAGMVLGALAMSGFFARKGSRLHRGALRWGFLVIGAAAYVDIAHTWLAAWHHHDAIPYGMNEGQGLSDPSHLSEEYGWTDSQLVTRYLLVAAACAVAFAASWWRAVRQQRERVRLVEAGKDPDDSSR